MPTPAPDERRLTGYQDAVPRPRLPRRAAALVVAAVVLGGAVAADPALAGPALAAGGASQTPAVAPRTAQAVTPTGRAAAAPAKVTPVTGARLSSRFGARGFRWRSGRHTGLDFAARTGTLVHAARAGTVVAAGWSGRYGRAVVVRHPGGERTRYAHLSRIQTEVGQRVAAGTVIGRVGRTGNATGPHLHFEVITRTGRFTDPYRWLRAR